MTNCLRPTDEPGGESFRKPFYCNHVMVVSQSSYGHCQDYKVKSACKAVLFLGLNTNDTA